MRKRTRKRIRTGGREKAMKQMEVSKWLKVITVLTGIAGRFLFFLVMPVMAHDIAVMYPEAAYLLWPGMIYGWGIGVICYAILWEFWKVCVEIGRDNSFSAENARAFAVISRLALVLAVVWFAGVVFLALVHALGAALAFFMLLIAFVSVVVAVLSAALSHLVYKSYEMRQENELTI